MMRTVAAAACRKTCIVAPLKHTLERAEGEEQHQQNREGTPHLL